MVIDTDLLQTFGYIFIYPFVAAFVCVTIAKWHYEKDLKKQYLAAKDKVANELNIAISNMLVAMRNLANTHKMIKVGTLKADDQKVIQSIQNTLMEINKNKMDSYQHLGKTGLYFGIDILEKVSKFLSELTNMVNNSDFDVFNNADAWDNYRREKISPVIQQIHDELKGTVSDNVKSFQLHT